MTNTEKNALREAAQKTAAKNGWGLNLYALREDYIKAARTNDEARLFYISELMTECNYHSELKAWSEGNYYAEEAAAMIEAIKTFAADPDKLENLETYLSRHFLTWLTTYANSPENLSSELTHFSRIL